MKTSIILMAGFLTMLSTSGLYARTVVSGGFGTDGASLESVPSEDSVDMAIAIYKALDVESRGEKKLKSIETENGMFECEGPKKGIHTTTAGCSFLTTSGDIISDSPTTVSLGSELSAELFDALSVDAIVSIGATTKQVGNLTCTKVVSQKSTVKCLLKDVMAFKANI